MAIDRVLIVNARPNRLAILAIFSNHALQWTFIRNALLILFAAELVGKVIGIIVARMQFKRLVREIEQQIITNTLQNTQENSTSNAEPFKPGYLSVTS